ncbi:MAG: alpha/beta hydrolase [Leptolyngbya sp. Prado105]|jgi:pimeloyl-ACP methyl ester carboxylesterase|nr:alpha/beta hydrolase [Leptolyngbya sp. Prado105]
MNGVVVDVVWVGASAGVIAFDRPLIKYLSRHKTIAFWQYEQTLDEASSFTGALELLHKYLEAQEPIHLIGHGASGVVALLYARLYPDKVKSLTLLSVAAQPAITWHTHYYTQRKLLPCSRQQILGQMVRTLFGTRLPFHTQAFVALLDRDLETSPNPHSLYELVRVPKGGVNMPLLVCAANDDVIIDRRSHAQWSRLLKLDDRLWRCPDGKHFFHFFYPEQVGDELLQFWQSIVPAMKLTA